MNRPTHLPKMQRIFLAILRARYGIAIAFLLLTAGGIYGATRIATDSAIDRLIVPGDPVARATEEFDKVFPEGDQALIMLEAPDPLSPAAVRAADRVEHALAKIPNV